MARIIPIIILVSRYFSKVSDMEHFSVVTSIIRASLSGDSVAFDKQVVRLRTRLENAGSKTEAETIDRLLTGSYRNSKEKPCRVELSRMTAGEN